MPRQDNPHTPLSPEWVEWAVRQGFQALAACLDYRKQGVDADEFERRRSAVLAEQQDPDRLRCSQKLPCRGLVMAFGESKRAVEWARDPRCRVNHHTLRNRLRMGWDPEKAITTPTLRSRKKEDSCNRSRYC